MKLYVGTSGYSYKEWKGSFYPSDLSPKEMLRFYAARLPAVEINNTFYRLPNVSLLESWVSQVPEEFRFAIKASQRITHIKRLKDVGEEIAYLTRVLGALNQCLGVILFQLPPNLKKDIERLRHFLEIVPRGFLIALEFRHPSWLSDDVLECVVARDAVVCVSDTDEAPASVMDGSPWGYLRLRRSAYSEEDLADWVERVQAQKWEGAFVFFKHEDAGTGPKFAHRFLELSGGGQSSCS